MLKTYKPFSVSNAVLRLKTAIPASIYTDILNRTKKTGVGTPVFHEHFMFTFYEHDSCSHFML